MTATKATTVLEALSAGLALILRGQWGQGDMISTTVDNVTCYCALGVVHKVTRDDDENLRSHITTIIEEDGHDEFPQSVVNALAEVLRDEGSRARLVEAGLSRLSIADYISDAEREAAEVSPDRANELLVLSVNDGQPRSVIEEVFKIAIENQARKVVA